MTTTEDSGDVLIELEREYSQIQQTLMELRVSRDGSGTDKDIIKLERRLEFLSEQLAAEQHHLEQHLAGIDAYNHRRDVNRQQFAAIVTSAQQLVSEVEAEVRIRLCSDVPPQTDAASLTATLTTISDQREKYLSQLRDESAKLEKELGQLNAELGKNEDILRSLKPEVLAEKDLHLSELQQAMAAEMSRLHRVHDQLFIISKEHQFHVQRGTNVKPRGAVAPSDTAVSRTETRLAKDIMMYRNKEADLAAEIKSLRAKEKLLDKQCKDAEAEFAETLKRREDLLRHERQSQEEATAEAEELLALKAEYFTALQSLKDKVPIPSRRTA